MNFSRRSRSLLTHRDLGRFPSEALFDRIGRAVAQAGCLPRKELFESWEVARRIRRRIRGRRVVELAAGHGLVAHILLLLDDSSKTALTIEAKPVASAALVAEAIVSRWPRLRGRVAPKTQDLAGASLRESDLVVSVHACGALSDVVITRALEARATLGLLPCCHDEETCDTGGLRGFLPVPLAVDATRVARLRAAGYEVFTQTIPADITPHNRLILAWPRRTLDPAASSPGDAAP